jgi:hypothetical protein
MFSVEVSTDVVKSYPDGSMITVQKLRYDTNGPWIDPVYVINCSTCLNKIGRNETLLEAQIGYVEHVLIEHVRPVIDEVEAAVEWTIQ